MNNLIKPFNSWTKLKNTKNYTEIPSYAINKAVPEDNFYTDRDIAKYCYNTFINKLKSTIDTSKYTFIEPSAGEGCFYDLLPKKRRKALDIKPQKQGTEKANFLVWYPEEDKKYMVIGNPPFGVRGALALAFLKRSLLFADYVGFILPMSFYTNGKGSNMSRVYNGNLIHSELLSKNSFYLPKTLKKVNVSTIFQIWKKGIKKDVFVDYDISDYVDIFTVCSAPARWCGMDKLDKYDCYISSTFYQNTTIVYRFEDVKYGSGYGLIIKKDKSKILNILENIDWTISCSQATNNCKHIRIHSIKKCLFKNGIGKICKEQQKTLF